MTRPGDEDEPFGKRSFDYELLDFGAGRKLERFGSRIVDRPAPAVMDKARRLPQVWSQVDARYEASRVAAGSWSPAELDAWTITHGELQFELKLTPAGQVGIFPEQAANWRWIGEQLAGASDRLVLNLFGYTGASTLAAALAGAGVTHVDAAASAVAWARRNAELSGLDTKPIRWIVEDAAKFVARETRRGRQYDAILLDPPSYGHGPAGENWKFEADIDPLLASCGQLLSKRPLFVLLTGHTPGWQGPELAELLREHFGAGAIESGEMNLVDRSGRKLPQGHFARWQPA